jgi:hypothetical protein
MYATVSDSIPSIEMLIADGVFHVKSSLCPSVVPMVLPPDTGAVSDGESRARDKLSDGVCINHWRDSKHVAKSMIENGKQMFDVYNQRMMIFVKTVLRESLILEDNTIQWTRNTKQKTFLSNSKRQE